MDKQQMQQEARLIGELKTMVSEGRNPDTLDIDQLDSLGVITQINEQDKGVAHAVSEALPAIAATVDAIVEAFARGGRLIYMGAGTSGRLGVLDAVECPPTYSVPDSQVVALIAGGDRAIYKAVEGAEDSEALAIEDLKRINASAKDVIVGIAASGRTPYVAGGLKYARELGAATAAVTCNPGAPILALADHGICAIVGPEALTGSTRMKSGTAQKMILNMLTTAAMIRSGKSYQNLMVDVHASNEKLYARASRIVIEATGCDHATARQALEAADFSAKVAIHMVLTGSDADTARDLLAQHQGFLRHAIDATR